MKLNAPLLKLTLPAFTDKGNLIIPYEMNPSVHFSQIKGFSIKFTETTNTGLINDSVIINTGEDDYWTNDKITIENVESLSNIRNKLIIQNAYYLQIAYINDNQETGNYSTAALIKYTNEPTLSCTTSPNNISFTGIYETEDLNEGLYKYQFIITDSNGNEFANSGEQIHNSLDDKIESQESKQIFTKSFEADLSEIKGNNIVNITKDESGQLWHQHVITQPGDYRINLKPGESLYIFNEGIAEYNKDYTYIAYYNNIEGNNKDILVKNLSKDQALVSNNSTFTFIYFPKPESLYLSDNGLKITNGDGAIYTLDIEEEMKNYIDSFKSDSKVYSIPQKTLTNETTAIEYIEQYDKEHKVDDLSENPITLISNNPISLTTKEIPFKQIKYGENQIDDFTYYSNIEIENDSTSIKISRLTPISLDMEWYNYSAYIRYKGKYNISGNIKNNDWFYIMDKAEYDKFIAEESYTPKCTYIVINSTPDPEKPISFTVEDNTYIILCRKKYQTGIQDEWWYTKTIGTDTVECLFPIQHYINNQWVQNTNYYYGLEEYPNTIEGIPSFDDNDIWYNYSMYNRKGKRTVNISNYAYLQYPPHNNENTQNTDNDENTQYAFAYRVKKDNYETFETQILNGKISIPVEKVLKLTEQSHEIELDDNEYLIVTTKNKNVFPKITLTKGDNSTLNLIHIDNGYWGDIQEETNGDEKNQYLEIDYNNQTSGYTNLRYKYSQDENITGKLVITGLNQGNEQDWCFWGVITDPQDSDLDKLTIYSGGPVAKNTNAYTFDINDMNISDTLFIVNTKNENWRQDIKVELFLDNEIPDKNINAQSIDINLSKNDISHKSLSSLGLFVNNYKKDQIERYNYIFTPADDVKEIFGYKPEGENIIPYYFTENILNNEAPFPAIYSSQKEPNEETKQYIVACEKNTDIQFFKEYGYYTIDDYLYFAENNPYDENNSTDCGSIKASDVFQITDINLFLQTLIDNDVTLKSGDKLTINVQNQIKINDEVLIDLGIGDKDFGYTLNNIPNPDSDFIIMRIISDYFQASFHNYAPGSEIQVNNFMEETNVKIYYYYQSLVNYTKAYIIQGLVANDVVYIMENIPKNNGFLSNVIYCNTITSDNMPLTILVPSQYYIVIMPNKGNSNLCVSMPNKLICKDTYSINKEYDNAQTYYLQYKTMSLNNLQKSTSIELNTKNILEPELKATVITKYDYENACVNISLKENENNEIRKGAYKLVRASNKDNYSTWTVLKSYSLSNIDQFIYQDRTVEQGVTYKYAYQQYNSHGVHSNFYGESEPIKVDFEYAYLGDKDRQIKLSFNTNVSSFKSTVFESKVDTLGGLYPFFFKNGNQSYKEFPITGLISYQLDQDEFFMKRSELNLEKNSTQRLSTNSQDQNIGMLSTTNQVDYNFTAERIFRLKLLEWLNNGQEKLFRSPTEGNYVVRLMNVSLAPNEQLSRMIANFSATAYECNSSEIADIVAAGRLVDASHLDNYVYTTKTEIITKTEQSIELLNDSIFSYVNISNAFPGTKIYFSKADSSEEVTYTIGQTGTLVSEHLPAANKLTIKTNVPIGSITYIEKTNIESLDTEFDKIISYKIINEAETFNSQGEKNILDNKNIYQIYTLIFEPESTSPGTCSINKNEFTVNRILSVDPSTFGKITSIKLKSNIKLHMYYSYIDETREGDSNV